MGLSTDTVATNETSKVNPPSLSILEDVTNMDTLLVNFHIVRDQEMIDNEILSKHNPFTSI